MKKLLLLHEFEALDHFTKQSITSAIVETCLAYFLTGDSLSLSIQKTYKGSAFVKKVITQAVRGNAQIVALNNARWAKHQRSRAWS